MSQNVRETKKIIIQLNKKTKEFLIAKIPSGCSQTWDNFFYNYSFE